MFIMFNARSLTIVTNVCFLFFGVSQEVISALRGTGQKVTLRLCKPETGVLPDMDPTIKVS